MAIYLEKYGLQYFPVPKNACTSLKSIFYFLDTGKKFEPTYSEGRYLHIHNWRGDYATTSYGSEYSKPVKTARKIAILRDPIARIVSCYTNRVRDHKELSEGHVDTNLADALGVQVNPSLEQFILGLTKYRALSGPVPPAGPDYPNGIKHHTDPQSYFLGPSLDAFDLIYRMEDLFQVERDLADITGITVEIPHEQDSDSGNIDIMNLTNKVKQELVRICAGDYALLRNYYEPPF